MPAPESTPTPPAEANEARVENTDNTKEQQPSNAEIEKQVEKLESKLGQVAITAMEIDKGSIESKVAELAKERVDRIYANKKFLRFVPILRDVMTSVYASKFNKQIKEIGSVHVGLDDKNNLTRLEGDDEFKEDFERVAKANEDEDYLHSGESVKKVEDEKRISGIQGKLSEFYQEVKKAGGDEEKIKELKAEFLKNNDITNENANGISANNIEKTLDNMADIARVHEISKEAVDKYLEKNLSLYDAKINSGVRTKAQLNKVIKWTLRGGIAAGVVVAVGGYFAKSGVRMVTGAVGAGAAFGALRGYSTAKRMIADEERQAAVSGEAMFGENEAGGGGEETNEQDAKKVMVDGNEVEPSATADEREILNASAEQEEESSAEDENKNENELSEEQAQDDFAERAEVKKKGNFLGKLMNKYTGKEKIEAASAERDRKSAKDLYDEINKYLEIGEDGKVVGLKEGLSDDDKDALMEAITEVRARNKVSDEKNVDLITYSKFENVDKERNALMQRMIEAKAELKKTIGSEEGRRAFDGELARMTSEKADNLKDNTVNVNRMMSKIARNQAIKGALTGAAIAVLGSLIANAAVHAEASADNVIDTAGGDNLEVAKPEIGNFKFTEDIDADGNPDFEFLSASGEKITGEIEIDDYGQPNLESFLAQHEEYRGVLDIEGMGVTSTPNTLTPLSEYLEGNPSEVGSYENIEFAPKELENSMYLVKDSGFRTPEGYTFKIAGEIQDGAQLAVKMPDGQLLTADVGPDGVVAIPEDSALGQIVMENNDYFAGDSVGIGVPNGDTFTYYSNSADLPSLDVASVNMPEIPASLEESVGAYAVTFNGETVSTFDVDDLKLDNFAELSDGTEIDTVLNRGGYDPSEDVFLNKSPDLPRSNFGEPLDLNNAELATEQWLVNVQTSPDQLAWNAMSLRGFQQEKLDNIMSEYFGSEWKLTLGIEGDIDTENEVNILANELAKNPGLCNRFRKEFLDQFKELISGGSVERYEIPEGGRYTVYNQANQYLSGNEADVTGSRIAATTTNTGGVGYYMRDKDGQSIFDEDWNNEMLKVKDGESVGDTYIRANCGAQPGKSIIKKTEPEKSEPEKVEPEKVEPEKVEPEKSEPEKIEPEKVEPEKVEPEKREPEKVEPEKSEPEKVEPEKSEPEKIEPEKTEPEKVEPEKSEPEKVEPEKVEPEKREPEKVEPEKSEPELTPKNPEAIMRNAGDVTPMGPGELTNGINSNGIYNPNTRTFEIPEDNTITTAPLTNDQTVSQNINTTLSGDGSGNTIAETIAQADQTYANDQNFTAEQIAQQETDRINDSIQQAADVAAAEMRSEGDRLANASTEELANYFNSN